MSETPANVLLPALPMAEPLPGAVLFGFDNYAFPFQHHVQTHLVPGGKPHIALPRGEAGSPDEVILHYGTVLRIGDRYHMWYAGNHAVPAGDPDAGTRKRRTRICYATSDDAIHWEKPDLGLVSFNGSTNNNFVDLPTGNLQPSAIVLHEPDDPDPARRFKLAYEALDPAAGINAFHVAFSADGLTWNPSSANPVGPWFEMSGIVKFRGLYYVSGQAVGTAHRPVNARRLCTFVSADFEYWSPVSAVGLDRSRDLHGPSTAGNWNNEEEIHLGAGLWNRGNVLLGVYGQWHGVPSGDRRNLTMDLGLTLSHDALHHIEPIRDFPFIPAREQPGSPSGSSPALMQGQGFVNTGDRTLYWYSAWRGADSSGVLAVSWERDRLGMLKPFHPEAAQAISCPVEVTSGEAAVTVNASGLGEYTQLRISLLDEGFRPIPGYSGEAAAIIGRSGFRIPVQWPGGAALPASLGRVRFDIAFTGIRPEDANLHALYIGEDQAS
jgi:hypothetical protein